MAENAARARIFDRIRTGLRRTPEDTLAASQAIEDRLARHPRNRVPARALGLGHGGLVDLFAAEAAAAQASVETVPAGSVPAALARYLQRHNLGATIAMAPDPGLDRYDWTAAPLLNIRRDRARAADAVGVTSAFAGIAETGTLMLLSGALTPATLHLLPDTHIVVLPEDRVVPVYEDAWDRWRAVGAGMPRTVTFVTGPSRTGDIEQRMQIGAHGPRRLHIMLVAGAAS